jgi:hypothetical protein
MDLRMKIVHGNDAGTGAKQLLSQRAPDETSTSSNQKVYHHIMFPRRRRRKQAAS